MCFKPKMPKAADPLAPAAPLKMIERGDPAAVKNTDIVQAAAGREASGRVGLGTSARRRRSGTGLAI